MTYRLPDLAAKMSPDQQFAFDAIKASPRGVVQGPLLAWLQSPAFADKAQALGAFCRYHTSLPPRLSELAIITTGAFWQAGFEWHVHAPIAIAAGLDPVEVEVLRVGGRPRFGQEDERAVWQFAHHLLHDHEVPEPVYRRVEALLGSPATVELVGILGYYGLISMTIKAFGIPVPSGASEPF